MLNSLFFLLISAVLLMVRRNHAAGVTCGIVGILSELAFSVFWFSEQAKGRVPWYELAFSNPLTIVLLAIGFGLTIANAVIYYRKKEEDYIN